MPDSEQAHLDRIARLIESVDSPVGIDARKTHVLIMRALERIEERLARLERAAGITDDHGRGREDGGGA